MNMPSGITKHNEWKYSFPCECGHPNHAVTIYLDDIFGDEDFASPEIGVSVIVADGYHYHYWSGSKWKTRWTNLKERFRVIFRALFNLKNEYHMSLQLNYDNIQSMSWLLAQASIYYSKYWNTYKPQIGQTCFLMQRRNSAVLGEYRIIFVESYNEEDFVGWVPTALVPLHGSDHAKWMKENDSKIN
jgi:hypothetical protein